MLEYCVVHKSEEDSNNFTVADCYLLGDCTIHKPEEDQLNVTVVDS